MLHKTTIFGIHCISLQLF
uniref:Uncharacterized protein n=1 Tax=Arundo donax TaxID=35708 RepID=A0A0A8ZKY9_ARUDO